MTLGGRVGGWGVARERDKESRGSEGVGEKERGRERDIPSFHLFGSG